MAYCISRSPHSPSAPIRKMSSRVVPVSVHSIIAELLSNTAHARALVVKVVDIEDTHLVLVEVDLVQWHP